jgi:hypothetical protein
MFPPEDYTVVSRTVTTLSYGCISWAAIYNTVKFILSGHPGDQKLVAVQDKWPFRIDCFNGECAAEGLK